ncbi:hypothetical protein EJ05DRAFT_139493 [Pseudovirgaria hyperparasitica]|uniref:N-acetyltransferase domain-containing protein n=1 Tax=Pseudovirgaria hyperparasitica TaxID=470096 RepID=A0A6A6VZY4_9PEZI|nr:uncharacterized protein EJ05DRAFT_139493 [Pseudovirgaria hyperparasitica]KAF2754371.1 hypothetical protein EJ05DRAFT_139493 [Pseudovirgaria hyperparasitica]
MEKFAATAITLVSSQCSVAQQMQFACSQAKHDLDLARAAAARGMPTATFGKKNDIRIVGIHEYKEAALSLAEAFEVDELSRYFIDVPDREHATEQEKWELHLSIFEYIVYAHCLKGLVTTTGPGYAAVALWLPPGDHIDDWATMLRSGMWRLRYKLSAEARKRFFDEFLPLLHDTKVGVLGALDESSWYLVYVGTRPSGRGKGYAKKLIEQISSLCDEEGRAIYLESSNAINPAIYRKMGFEDRKRVYMQRILDRNVELDIMVRMPKAADEKVIIREKLPAASVKIHRLQV